MQSNNRKWWALVAISLGTLMSLLDITIVNVAFPVIQHDLSANYTNLQWILNIYTLILAAVMLLVSKLGDHFGRKKIYLIALIIFTVASVLNGLSDTLTMLIWSRGLQAVGGAGILGLSAALVASHFDGKERGVAMGIMGSVIGISAAIGPLIGGILITNFGWPSIFFVNLPVGIIAVIVATFTLQETPSYGTDKPIDILGMLLSAGMMFSFVYGLIIKESHLNWHWTNGHIISWLIAGVLLLIGFIWQENHTSEPMMDFKLFKNSAFVGASLASFALGTTLFASMVFLTTLMQNYMGYSALNTGYIFIAFSIWGFVLGPIIGSLSHRVPKNRLISFAFFAAAVGFAWIASQLSVNFTLWQLIVGLIIMGIGNAILNPTINMVAMADVAPHQMGMASGITSTVRQFGITLGVVLFGLIQNNTYAQHLQNWHGSTNLHHALITAGSLAGHGLIFSKTLRDLPHLDDLQRQVSAAFYAGMRANFYTVALVLVVALVLTYFLIQNKKSDA